NSSAMTRKEFSLATQWTRETRSSASRARRISRARIAPEAPVMATVKCINAASSYLLLAASSYGPTLFDWHWFCGAIVDPSSQNRDLGTRRLSQVRVPVSPKRSYRNLKRNLRFSNKSRACSWKSFRTAHRVRRIPRNAEQKLLLQRAVRHRLSRSQPVYRY